VVAGASIVVGALGVAYGLKSGGSAEQAAAHVATPAPAASMPAPQVPVAKEPTKVAVELEADVANARVVFRRRVASAPMKTDVNPVDVVELVEFSAPGYKTERYWLTFDRVTHLRRLAVAPVADAPVDVILHLAPPRAWYVLQVRVQDGGVGHVPLLSATSCAIRVRASVPL